ncbi:MAG: right-handed parallel beta-helix repeat-containing protein [Actinomycetota bacterium]|jgi:plastocyanin|nr:right-handed parallel beta-helix repeat-containing protein [Actinomycetota bacterium]|tara:strand:- start:2544 stop:4532 length:1989 start_codon:yes stop_codon:yes gene_type:complete
MGKSDKVSYGKILFFACLSLIVSACGSGDASGPEAQIVRVVDDEFSPKILRVPVGSTVIWESGGANDHNVIASDGSWQAVSSDYFEYGIITKGDQFEHTFNEAGVYEYYCPFHGTNNKGMVGIIIVGDVDYVPPPEEVNTALSTDVLEVGKSLQYETIQSAVDAAKAGDLILINSGVYNESVTITTPYLTIRGKDRNGVIIDGEFMRENGIQIYDTDGVSVENLSVRNFSLNAVYWNGSKGYKASHVTVYNNGDYGVYAFDSTDGVFEKIYASGHPDSGIYIGQCYPCNALIYDSVVEGNALGYSGTNAGGHLYIYNNIWRDNMSGIIPNTLDSELNPPGRETTIVGNLVVDNNNYEAPANRFGLVAQGMGIVMPGRVGDVVEKNIVINHDKYGLVASPMLDVNLYFSQHVRVKNNVIMDSGYTDLALAGPWGPGNCYEGNIYQTSTPPLLEQLHDCESVGNGSLLSRFPLQGDVSGLMMLAGLFADAASQEAPKARYKDYPWPEPQENMTFADINKPSPAINLFYVPDMNSLDLPFHLLGGDSIEDLIGAEKEIIMSGVPITSPNVWQLLFQLYGYLMPFVLYAAWAALAIKDIDSNEKVKGSGKYMWLAIVYLVPFFGVLIYHLAGPSEISRSTKVAAIGGGLISYIVILVAGAVISGLV